MTKKISDPYQNHLHVNSYDAPQDKNVIPHDINFYVELCKDSKNILELACGTGRILTELATTISAQITGLDYSNKMLNIAKGKIKQLPKEAQQRIQISHGDMTNFELDGKFDNIILGCRTFHMLQTQEAQLQCLTNISNHLNPKGKVALHLFCPNYAILTKGAEPTYKEFTNTKTGNIVKRITLNSKTDYIKQSVTSTVQFTEYDQKGAQLNSEVEKFAMRWVFKAEFKLLAQIAGLEILQEYSNFKKDPLTYGEEQIFILGLKTLGTNPINYDRASDCAYIKIPSLDTKVVKTEQLNPYVIIDRNSHTEIVGVEILQISKITNKNV